MTHPAIDLCMSGGISPPVALARLALDGMTPDAIEAILPAHSDIARLFAMHRDKLANLAAMLAASDICHDAPVRDARASVAAIASMFDSAVGMAPEASVAAYSLGDSELLAAATEELIAWLLGEGLAGHRKDALDLGCGIGRVAAALAPHVRRVVGLDVSAGMIGEARRRHAAPNLRFAQTDGLPRRDLHGSPFDLVLAVDSMPYLVQAGIARDHVAALSRMLRPHGHLVILNLSYRGDDKADAATAREWAAAFGFRLLMCGERPFTLWDGSAYVLERA